VHRVIAFAAQWAIDGPSFRTYVEQILATRRQRHRDILNAVLSKAAARSIDSCGRSQALASRISARASAYLANTGYAQLIVKCSNGLRIAAIQFNSLIRGELQ
jgi:hypothetical protein